MLVVVHSKVIGSASHFPLCLNLCYLSINRKTQVLTAKKIHFYAAVTCACISDAQL